MAEKTELLTKLKGMDEHSAILSTGQHPDRFKDLLVVGRDTRRTYFKRLTRLCASLDYRAEECDDALLVGDAEQQRIGIAYHEGEDFIEATESIASGNIRDPEIRPWAIGPWLPEVYASDLSRSFCLQEGTEPRILHQVGKFKQGYPEGLAGAIVSRCLQEIAMKSKTLETRQCDKLMRGYLVSDICLAGIRTLYAQDRVYFRGLKYNSETLSELSEESAMQVTNILVNPDAEVLKINARCGK